MKLSQFLKQNNVESINLYPSTVSDRLVGSIVIDDRKKTVVTTVGFDTTKESFVVPTEVTDTETGEMKLIYVLTNKVPSKPAVTLSA